LYVKREKRGERERKGGERQRRWEEREEYEAAV
jgi:hypothetical protein